VPSKQAVLRGEAGDGEDLDGFMSEKGSERCRRDARGVQSERSDVDDMTVVIAEWSIREDELADAMPWSRERW
jgi:hypothetical protein